MEAGLYLCATPIGNLDDITLRVIKTLENVDVIYAEDTRHTLGLLNHLSIKKPLVSCHEHNEEMRAAEIAEKIRDGNAVAFVSDAGMPCVSDPGERLVAMCIRENLKYTVLPGASASLCALAISGMSVKNACFVGFLPRSGKERRDEVSRLANHTGSLIIYESPQRVGTTCGYLAQILGDRNVVLVREITKMYEEAVRGTLNTLCERYSDTAPKGECVLVVDGMNEQAKENIAPDEMVKSLIESGMSAKDAAKQVSALADIPRNEAYALAMKYKNSQE